MVENDPATKDKLHIVYLENYSVSTSERLMPASEVSQQISMAGKEASGTGNMKFMINGAVTMGTYDGANIEIKQCCGAENFIQFGMLPEETRALAQEGYNPRKYIARSKVLQDVLALLEGGINGDYFNEIVDNLYNSDPFMVCADFDSYHNAQIKLQEIYSDRMRWARMSLMNIANAGMFSADRAIEEYAQEIWGLEKVKTGKRSFWNFK
jgi:starch phosphorylase